MADAPKRKRGTKVQFDNAFSPVAMQMGHLARSWNALHEYFGLIFAYMIAPHDIGLPLAVWHSTQSDRSQREMLRAVNRAWIYRHPHGKKEFNEELIWLLGKADSLSDKRNDALHAPLEVHMNMGTFEFTVEAGYVFGNPRAAKLDGKDILATFQLYRVQIECLRSYASKLHVSLASARPLPQRPLVPSSVPSPTRRKQPRPAPTT